MACGWVAVQIQTSSRFQHTSQFLQARRHHGQVSHHVAIAQDQVECPQSIRNRTALFHLACVGLNGVLVPLPGVFKGLDLRAGLRPILLAKSTL